MPKIEKVGESHGCFKYKEGGGISERYLELQLVELIEKVNEIIGILNTERTTDTTSLFSEKTKQLWERIQIKWQL